MKRNDDENDWRRKFTTVLLGGVAVGSLLLGSYRHSPSPIESVGLQVITLCSLLLMVFILIENPKSLGFENENKITGRTEIRVSTLAGEHGAVDTVTGFLPERARVEERSAEEKRLTRELKQVLRPEQGLTLDACNEGLKLLDENESVVRTSWTHKLNRARLLAATMQLAEAEGLAYGVIKEYPLSNEAIGIAHEVLSFIVELRKPAGGGSAYRRWLEKRLYHVSEGLKYHPTGHDLLMNAFEVAVLQRDAARALDYLNRAVLVDRERTGANLEINPLTKKAVRLSPAVKAAIRELVEGGNKMEVFEMSRVRTWVLILTLAATSSGLCNVARPAQNDAPSLLSRVTALCEKAASLAPVVDSPGTSFGRAFTYLVKAGTSFGHLKGGTSFGRLGAGRTSEGGK